MTNVIQFPQSPCDTTKHSKDYDSDIEQMIDDLRLALKVAPSSREKLAFMKTLKGVLKSRGVGFRSSPPKGLENLKSAFTIFVEETKIVFGMDKRKDTSLPSDWVFVQMDASSPPAVVAGQLISKIGESHGHEKARTTEPNRSRAQ